MSIIYHESTRTFHLTNGKVSYIFTILRNEQLGQLYYGKAIHDREDFSHLFEMYHRSMTAYAYEGDHLFSLEYIKQELPTYGSGDFRHPAITIDQPNGSSISNFQYVSHTIEPGKPKLEGLPATYVESDDEADTLSILLKDPLTGVEVTLLYTVFADYAAIARSMKVTNEGNETVQLSTAMSLSLDLPDADYEWQQLSGTWSRERHIKTRKLEQGIQSVESARGNSSHNHNPFIALTRPDITEGDGEAIGFSLVYSGNFLAQAEVDNYDVTRVQIGINPFGFAWKLAPGDSFQTPEAVMVYSSNGLNGMSQQFHGLYRTRLARGEWRDRDRPILINNWEATRFDFTEEKIVDIARAAKEDGIELFVLDDGWFGERTNDHAGLGDWYPNHERLVNGIKGLSEKIEDLGMKFGLWFEPEMVNKDSDLYRAHPDWIINTPGRAQSQTRNQYVLDFSRKEVVDNLYEQMSTLIADAKISYIKWDMNRCITECYSAAFPADQQGEIFHRYILGVYDLYERLTSRFPHILFESCSSGGGRFDPGLLYYAPQCWASDDTDAIERLKIQYGTSMVYPISSIGAHVSVTPNHQINRITPLSTRANVAFFGAFGYELDLNVLTPEEREMVKQQVQFMREHRSLLQRGTFYRLLSPFDSNVVSWMVVSEDRKQAIVAYYKVLNEVNAPFKRIKLQGLDPDLEYDLVGEGYQVFGDELMNTGLVATDESSGQTKGKSCEDFYSRLFVLEAR